MRQTGQTFKQMRAAPQGAVFIWCNAQLDYPRRVAIDAGRTDLVVVAPHWVESMAWQGRILPGIVTDHALITSPEMLERLKCIRALTVRRM